MTTPEGIILRQVRDYLDNMGIYHCRINNIPAPLPGGKFRRFTGTPGMSDLIIVCNGKTVFCEVKGQKGKQSDAQKRFAQDVVDNGGIYICVKSVEELESDLIEAGVLGMRVFPENVVRPVHIGCDNHAEGFLLRPGDTKR